MTKSKDAAAVTDTPAGLDVAVVEPGTIVGSRDLQGADGTERTDRPGEILGTPVLADASEQRRADSKAREKAKADHITAEVDRANREELPKLGGPIDDGWEPTAAPARSTATRTADAARGVTTTAVGRMPAPAAPADSGIKVSPKIDRS